jgi:hypothetical protein
MEVCVEVVQDAYPQAVATQKKEQEAEPPSKQPYQPLSPAGLAGLIGFPVFRWNGTQSFYKNTALAPRSQLNFLPQTQHA